MKKYSLFCYRSCCLLVRLILLLLIPAPVLAVSFTWDAGADWNKYDQPGYSARVAAVAYDLVTDLELGRSLTNKSLSDIDFVSTTSGSEDLHIQSTSNAVGVGTDPTAIIIHDIDGDTRGSTNVEIGADEL